MKKFVKKFGFPFESFKSLQFRGHVSDFSVFNSVLIWNQKVKVLCKERDGEALEKIIESNIFQEWLRKMNSIKNENTPYKINQIEIQNVDFFKSQKIGFIKMKVDVSTMLENGQQVSIPGITLLRGSSVAILIVLTHEKTGKKFVLLTQQPRIPTGNLEYLEIPAGMMDGDGYTFAAKAAEEIEEETGLKINMSDLFDLSSYMGSQKDGISSSPGLLDEQIKIFLYEAIIKEEDIKRIEHRDTGLKEEGEVIKLRLFPFEDVHLHSNDSKLYCSLFLYQRYLNDKKYKCPTD